MDGLATLRAMSLPLPGVLVLTTFDDDHAVLQALRAGARGYLLKDVTLDHLVAAIRTVSVGGSVVQPGITEGLLQRVDRHSAEFERFDRAEQLTAREVEILRLVVGGGTPTERSPRRCTSPKALSRTTSPRSWRSLAYETELGRHFAVWNLV